MNNKTIKILILEDNAADALLIKKACTKLHFDFVHATCLAEAKEYVNTKFDLILSDLDVGDSRGISTLTEMYVHFKLVPIVVLTGFSKYRYDSIALGVASFLSKRRITVERLQEIMLQTVEYNPIDKINYMIDYLKKNRLDDKNLEKLEEIIASN